MCRTCLGYKQSHKPMPSAEILDIDDKGAFLVFENQPKAYTSIFSTAENLFVCMYNYC